MVVPAPPTICGPVLSCSPAVRVEGALAGATIVLADISGTPYAKQQASRNGDSWVTVEAPLPAGALLVATQELDDEVSDLSEEVRVEETPKTLPKPAFEALLNPCSDAVLVSGLLPGSDVLIRRGVTSTLVGTATRTTQWFPVPRSTGMLTEGEQIHVRQRLTGRPDSAETESEPVGILPGASGRPGAPQVLPVTACQSEITFTGIAPTATVRADFDDGSWSTWQAPAPTFTGQRSRRIPEGTVRVTQALPGCEFTSPETKAVIGPEQAPPTPVPAEFCPAARMIRVDQLVSGATVEFAVRSGGTETPLAVAGARGGMQDFRLPRVVGGTGPHAEIVVRQKLCTLASDAAAASEVPRDAKPQPVRIVEFVFPCQQEVLIAGGSGTGVVYSETLDRAISDPFVAGSIPAATPGQPDLPRRVPLHYPTIPGDRLTVRFTGCNASDPATTQVYSAPFIGDEPKVVPPLPGDAGLLVYNLWVGNVVARVNGKIRAIGKTDPYTMTCWLPLGEPLREGDRYWVYMRVCSMTSNRDGALTVEKGTLRVQANKGTLVAREAASLAITATNAATGALVPDLPVTLDGVNVGVTGKKFSYKPTTPATLQGRVEGGARFRDESFTVLVTAPAPPPPPKEPTYQLRLTGYVQDGSSEVRVHKVTWLLQPSWTTSTVKLETNGLSGSVTLPPIPPGTSQPVVDIALDEAGYDAECRGDGGTWVPLNGHLTEKSPGEPLLPRIEAGTGQDHELVFYQSPPERRQVADSYGKLVGILWFAAIALHQIK